MFFDPMMSEWVGGLFAALLSLGLVVAVSASWRPW
jgi:hypothetical protein